MRRFLVACAPKTPLRRAFQLHFAGNGRPALPQIELL
jgi:hypothetical protein